MITPEEKATLNDVLNEFVAKYEQPTADALESWAKRYPQYRNELIDFVAAWAEQLTLPQAPKLNAEQEKILVDRAMSHVANVTFKRDEGTQKGMDSVKPINSLVGEAKKMGYSPLEFAKACGLDLALISKLNNRLIHPDSIPPQLVRHMARLIKRMVVAIEKYLALPPNVSVARAFLSRKKPESTGQQSFADAVRDSSLPDVEKARWLDESKGPGES